MNYDEYLHDHETTVNNIRYDHDADVAYGTLDLIDAGSDEWVIRLRKTGKYALLKANRARYSQGTGVVVSRQHLVRQGQIDLQNYRLREIREDNETLIAALKEAAVDAGRQVARDILNTAIQAVPTLTIGSFLVDLFSSEPYLGSKIRLAGSTTLEWVQPYQQNEGNPDLFHFATNVILRHREVHNVPFRLLISLPKPESAREQMTISQRRCALAQAIAAVSWPDPKPIIDLLLASSPAA